MARERPAPLGGPRLVRESLIGFVESAFPAHLEEMRSAWALKKDELPDPVLYSRTPLRAIDRTPAIAAAVLRLPTVRRQGYSLTPPGIDFDTTYSVRLFVWVKAAGWDETIDQRDDITTALRGLLVQSPTIGVANEAAVVLEDTLMEDYSEVTPVKGERFVAGSFIAFNLRVAEAVLLGSAAGSGESVATMRVLAYPLPHPAL